MSFSVWLISLRIVVLKSTHHAATSLMTLISWLSDIPLYISTTAPLSIFLFPGILKVYWSGGSCKQSSPKLWGACVLWIFSFPNLYAHEWKCPMLSSCVFYMFLETPYTSPEWLLAIYIPPMSVIRLPFLPGLSCISGFYTFLGWPFWPMGRETSL